jgi:hypothetical protein
MNREVHVQFWEGVGLRCPALLAYLRAYQNVAEARHRIAAYFDFYNCERLHQVLDYRARASLAPLCFFYFDSLRWTQLLRQRSPDLEVHISHSFHDAPCRPYALGRCT